ncbi:Guanine nucleotide exchange factor lte1 [Blastocladiella emersonii ATCC 22665]|nr:Guanine nucleotide exchange factor lte1 [Blastocladiella emersonii ATCC 22665]
MAGSKKKGLGIFGASGSASSLPSSINSDANSFADPPASPVSTASAPPRSRFGSFSSLPRKLGKNAPAAAAASSSTALGGGGEPTSRRHRAMSVSSASSASISVRSSFDDPAWAANGVGAGMTFHQLGGAASASATSPPAAGSPIVSSVAAWRARFAQSVSRPAAKAAKAVKAAAAKASSSSSSSGKKQRKAAKGSPKGSVAVLSPYANHGSLGADDGDDGYPTGASRYDSLPRGFRRGPYGAALSTKSATFHGASEGNAFLEALDLSADTSAARVVDPIMSPTASPSPLAAANSPLSSSVPMPSSVRSPRTLPPSSSHAPSSPLPGSAAPPASPKPSVISRRKHLAASTALRPRSRRHSVSSPEFQQLAEIYGWSLESGRPAMPALRSPRVPHSPALGSLSPRPPASADFVLSPSIASSVLLSPQVPNSDLAAAPAAAGSPVPLPPKTPVLAAAAEQPAAAGGSPPPSASGSPLVSRSLGRNTAAAAAGAALAGAGSGSGDDDAASPHLQRRFADDVEWWRHVEQSYKRRASAASSRIGSAPSTLNRKRYTASSSHSSSQHQTQQQQQGGRSHSGRGSSRRFTGVTADDAPAVPAIPPLASLSLPLSPATELTFAEMLISSPTESEMPSSAATAGPALPASPPATSIPSSAFTSKAPSPMLGPVSPNAPPVPSLPMPIPDAAAMQAPPSPPQTHTSSSYSESALSRQPSLRDSHTYGPPSGPALASTASATPGAADQDQDDVTMFIKEHRRQYRLQTAAAAAAMRQARLAAVAAGDVSAGDAVSAMVPAVAAAADDDDAATVTTVSSAASFARLSQVGLGITTDEDDDRRMSYYSAFSASEFQQAAGGDRPRSFLAHEVGENEEDVQLNLAPPTGPLEPIPGSPDAVADAPAPAQTDAAPAAVADVVDVVVAPIVPAEALTQPIPLPDLGFRVPELETNIDVFAWAGGDAAGAVSKPEDEAALEAQMSATALELVRRLTQGVDYEFMLDFFIVYRLFMDPVHLAKLLILRIRAAVPWPEDSDERRIIRMRSFVVIRHWLQFYFEHDFADNKKLRRYMGKALKTLTHMPELTTTGMDGRMIKKLKHLWIASVDQYVKNRVPIPSVPPPPIPAHLQQQQQQPPQSQAAAAAETTMTPPLTPTRAHVRSSMWSTTTGTSHFTSTSAEDLAVAAAVAAGEYGAVPPLSITIPGMPSSSASSHNPLSRSVSNASAGTSASARSTPLHSATTSTCVTPRNANHPDDGDVDPELLAAYPLRPARLNPPRNSVQSRDSAITGSVHESLRSSLMAQQQQLAAQQQGQNQQHSSHQHDFEWYPEDEIDRYMERENAAGAVSSTSLSEFALSQNGGSAVYLPATAADENDDANETVLSFEDVAKGQVLVPSRSGTPAPVEPIASVETEPKPEILSPPPVPIKDEPAPSSITIATPLTRSSAGAEAAIARPGSPLGRLAKHRSRDSMASFTRVARGSVSGPPSAATSATAAAQPSNTGSGDIVRAAVGKLKSMFKPGKETSSGGFPRSSTGGRSAVSVAGGGAPNSGGVLGDSENSVLLRPRPHQIAKAAQQQIVSPPRMDRHDSAIAADDAGGLGIRGVPALSIDTAAGGRVWASPASAATAGPFGSPAMVDSAMYPDMSGFGVTGGVSSTSLAPTVVQYAPQPQQIMTTPPTVPNYDQDFVALPSAAPSSGGGANPEDPAGALAAAAEALGISQAEDLPIGALPSLRNPSKQPPWVMRVRSAEVAQHLSIVDQVVIRNVDWTELLDIAVGRHSFVRRGRAMFSGSMASGGSTPSGAGLGGEGDEEYDPHDNVKHVIDRFNTTCQWVASQILIVEDASMRAKVIEKFIKIAAKCEAYSNYCTLMAITLALQAPHIDRLKRTWAKVSAEKKATLAHLIELTSPFHNFKNLRKAMEDSSTGVPFIGIYFSDLLFNSELPSTVSLRSSSSSDASDVGSASDASDTEASPSSGSARAARPRPASNLTDGAETGADADTEGESAATASSSSRRRLSHTEQLDKEARAVRASKYKSLARSISAAKQLTLRTTSLPPTGSGAGSQSAGASLGGGSSSAASAFSSLGPSTRTSAASSAASSVLNSPSSVSMSASAVSSSVAAASRAIVDLENDLTTVVNWQKYKTIAKVVKQFKTFLDSPSYAATCSWPMRDDVFWHCVFIDREVLDSDELAERSYVYEPSQRRSVAVRSSH